MEKDVLPWKGKFCHGKVCFAVEKYVLPWQIWATVAMCSHGYLCKGNEKETPATLKGHYVYTM